MAIRRHRWLWALVVAPALACASAPRTGSLQAKLDATPPGGVFLLPVGISTGDLVVRQPVVIRGAPSGDSVLSSPSPLIVLVSGVRVEALGLSGARVGIEVRTGGDVSIRDVTIEAREAGVAVDPGGAATIEDSTLRCTGSAGFGAREAQGRLRAARVTVAGTCRRDIAGHGGVLELHRVHLQDATGAGLHVVEGRLLVSDSDIEDLDPRAPGLFAARADVTAKGLRITGGEEGVLLRGGQATFDELSAAGAVEAGLSVIGGHVTIGGSDFTGPFRQGAICPLDGSDVTLSDVQVGLAGAAGVFAVGARVTADHLTITGARFDGDGDYGHGLTFTRSTATLRSVAVRDVEGAALAGTNMTTVVDADGFTVTDAGAAVIALLGARVSLRNVSGRGLAVGAIAARNAAITLGDGHLRAGIGIIESGGGTVSEGAGIRIDALETRQSCAAHTLDQEWTPLLRGARR